MKSLITASLLWLVILSAPVFAQGNEENALQSGTIDEQFEFIYRNSNNFQEYKVVRRSFLDRLQENMLDSIQTMRAEVLGLKTEVQSRQDSIQSIQNLLEKSESEKQEAISAKDQFSFMGIGINKSLYSSLMWILVAVLAASLGLFSFKYFRSFTKIRKAEKDLFELQEEFEQHRKNTLNRERKLKRELIDAQMGKS